MTRSTSAESLDIETVGDLLHREGHGTAESLGNSHHDHNGSQLDGNHLGGNRLGGDGDNWELPDLRRRLETLPVIEQSKGILMGRYGIDADTAFDVLRRLASDHNIKLRDISRAIVAAAVSSHPTGGLRPTLGALLHDIEAGRPRSAS